MLDSIRFVQGAVAKKDFVPALKHFRIEGNRITSYNGVLALSSPVDLSITATPRAEQFAKAIATCAGEISLTVTPTGRIGIRSGKFRAFVDCIEEPFPIIEPTGTLRNCDVPFLDALKRVWPFVSDDASRAWSLGVLFAGRSLLATNNVIAVEAWLGQAIPFETSVAIPKEALVEIMRIGIEPTGYRVDATGLTLHYPDGRWLQTRLLSTTWPDVVGVLDDAHAGACPPIHNELLPALESLGPFIDDTHRVYYGGERLSTTLHDDSGASVDLGALEGQGIFNYFMLQKVVRVATHLDLSHARGPRCPFLADGLRGVIIGYC